MHQGKIAVALALLLVPTGAAYGSELTGTSTSVEEHTTYVELVAHDGRKAPGFAAIAGLVSCEAGSSIDNAILWFNDQVLFREGRRGPDTRCTTDGPAEYVWAVEEGAPDPRGDPSLAPTGDVFSFTDPNGLSWTVHEYVYHVLYAYRSESTTVSAAGITAGAELSGEARMIPHYTWVVEIGTAMLDPTIAEYYNFVTVIDFEHLEERSKDRQVHSGEPGDPRTGNSHDASDPDEQHRTPHMHDAVDIHLFTGPEPEPGDGEGFEQGARLDPKLLLPEDVSMPEHQVQDPPSPERGQVDTA